MSYSAEQLLKMASSYDNVATQALVVTAKKKEKKNLDPKAKVRNRGTVCVPAEQAKDKKDHFPINDADQARNALARVHQYSSVPDWYKGSLSGLQALVARKVKAKYPKIDVGGKKEKKSSVDYLLSKYAQEPSYGDMNEYELAQAAQQAAQQDHPGIGKVPAEVWLKGLADQGKIPGRLYQATLGVLKMMGTPQTRQAPTTTPAPTGQAKAGIDPFIQATQRFLLNKGFKLPQYGADGKMGTETSNALKAWQTQMQEVGGDVQPTGQLDQKTRALLKDLVQPYMGQNAQIVRTNPF